MRQVGAATSQDTQAPSGMSLGTGVRVVATEKTYTQGNLSQTGNSLDLAINGRGFFQILLPDGTLAYTRAGDFQLSSQGQLVTASGYVVQPGISIPQGAQSISIGADGVVSVLLTRHATPTQVGSLQLADFVNPTGLQARREPAARDRRQRHGPARYPGAVGPRPARAGRDREFQRQCGRGNGGDDRNAARL